MDGDINSTDNPLTITSIDSNLTLTANFSLQSHNLVIISGEGGSVEGAGSFEHGSLQVINATPNEGYFFEGWTGSGISDPNSTTTTIQMTEDRNITASFSIKKHSLSVISGEGGNVSGEGNYTHGSTPSIIATPDQGFIFSGWFGDGVTNPDAMTTTVSMKEERIVTGTFTAIDYGLVLNSSIGGSVRGEGNYSHGEVVTITAIPDSGYQFDSWSGDIEGNLSSPSRSFLMESNNSITANFIAVEENHFVLTILSNPQNGGSSTGSATIW